MALDAFLPMAPWTLAVVLLISTVPKTVIALIIVMKIPPERQPAVLKALAELYRAGSFLGGFRRSRPPGST